MLGAKAGPVEVAGGVSSAVPARTPSMDSVPFPPLAELAPKGGELFPVTGPDIGANAGAVLPIAALFPPEVLSLLLA